MKPDPIDQLLSQIQSSHPAPLATPMATPQPNASSHPDLKTTTNSIDQLLSELDQLDQSYPPASSAAEGTAPVQPTSPVTNPQFSALLHSPENPLSPVKQPPNQSANQLPKQTKNYSSIAPSNHSANHSEIYSENYPASHSEIHSKNILQDDSPSSPSSPSSPDSPSSPGSPDSTERLLAEIQHLYTEQDRQQRQQHQQAAIIAAQQQAIRQQQHRMKVMQQAQTWLRALDANTSEAAWFEEFATKYNSRVEAAIDFLGLSWQE